MLCEVKEEGENDDGESWTNSDLPHFPPLKEVCPSAVPLGSAGRSKLNTSLFGWGGGVMAWAGLDQCLLPRHYSNPVLSIQ